MSSHSRARRTQRCSLPGFSIEPDVIALFDVAQSALGPLTGIVINAGIVAPLLPLADMTSERLRRVFEVNIYGAYPTGGR